MYQVGMSLAMTGHPLHGAAVVSQPAGGSVGETLELSKEELRRRVASLPSELSRWQSRAKAELDMNIHLSQLRALDNLVAAFTKDQLEMVEALNPQGNRGQFLQRGFDVVNEIIRAQGIWDFYREKFQLRFSPDFKAALRVADITAWDCYRPVVENAADLGILPQREVRKPPLCYYKADFSPETWVRGSEPPDLRDRQRGTIRTPIPVIQLPWDHAENLWEFLSLPHEVGHDIEADLNLRTALLQSLEDALRQGGRQDDRIQVWKAWMAETFADLVALQLVGPAFTEALMHLLLLPPAYVTTYNDADPHPTHYVRILMDTAYLRGLIQGEQPAAIRQRQELSSHAGRIEEVWKGIYGDPPQLQNYITDFPLVFKGLMDTPLPVLKGNTVRALIPYSAADDIRIRAAADYLETGRNRPGRLRPRHCVAAARLAVTESSRQRNGLAMTLQSINDRTARLVNDNAPQGVLASSDLKKHRDFIASFAKTISIKPGR